MNIKDFGSVLLGLSVFVSGSALAQSGGSSWQVNDILFHKSPQREVTLSGVVDLMAVQSDFNPVLQSTEIEDKNEVNQTSVSVKIDHVPEFFREDVRTSNAQYKSGSVETPVIIRQFNGASDNQYTPPDNSIAVSNAGYVVSVMNSNYRIFSPNSSTQLKFSSFHDALKTTFPAITDVYYDPRVLYDAANDRFIICVLNGIVSGTSHIVFLFSKSGNPADGWNAYAVSGDIFSKGEWTDYPNIGISKSDLFITGNLYNDNEAAIEPAILQINKNTGYLGGSINFQSWELIKNPGGQPSFLTLVPASQGQGKDYGDSMYFVCHSLGSGNNVRLIEITGSQASGSAVITTNSLIYYTSLLYSSPIASDQKQGTSTSYTLNSGDNRIKQAFYLNHIIHYVFSTQDQFSGFTDLIYCRLNVSNQTVQHVDLGLSKFNYVYPSIAWLGTKSSDQSVLIGYCRGGASIYPEIDAVQCDNSFTFSPSITVYGGLSTVTGSTTEVRWGDYTGLARQYSTNQCLFAGAYGVSNTYQTRIAEIGLNSTKKNAVNNQAASTLSGAYSVYPNPVADIFHLDFNVDKRAHINITVFDMNGRRVEQLYDGVLQQGEQNFSFNKAALSSGIYNLLISAGNGETLAAKKIVVK